MQTVREIKSAIKSSLCAQQKQITVTGFNALSLFEQVLDENPLIAYQVESISYAPSFGSTTIYVTYNSDELPQFVSRVNSEDEFERALHESIGKYAAKALIIAKPSVDVVKAYYNFHAAYSGYYSNLLKMEFAQKQFSGSDEVWTIFTFTYRIGRLKLGMMERAVDAKVIELAKGLFCPSMSKQTKAYVAHNYLALNVEYCNNDDAPPLERSYLQSAYGALINNRCVCQGYAEAYKRLLDEAGVACYVLCGKIRGSKENHAWNIVSFNDKDYFHVDVTWDAEKTYLRHDYYGLSDAQISKDRIWTRLSHMTCNSSEDILALARREIATRKEQYIARGIPKKYLGL